MFVGHYSASFLIRRADRDTPLWLQLLAVQMLDVVCMSLVLLGVEDMRVVPGITASTWMDLRYIPYSHSLPGALAWSAAAFLAYRLLRPGRSKSAALIGLAVFSHWVLDVVVHSRDVPLYDDHYKIGLGVWNYPVAAFLLEAGLLAGAMIAYARSPSCVRPRSAIALGAVLLVVQVAFVWGPPPSSVTLAAFGGLATFALVAGCGAWLERRLPRPPVSSPSPVPPG